MADYANNTSTTGSRLPEDLPWSGVQTGVGLSPDIESIAGEEEQALPPRPVRAAANDRAALPGDIAEGQMNGEINPTRDISWL